MCLDGFKAGGALLLLSMSKMLSPHKMQNSFDCYFLHDQNVTKTLDCRPHQCRDFELTISAILV